MRGIAVFAECLAGGWIAGSGSAFYCTLLYGVLADLKSQEKTGKSGENPEFWGKPGISSVVTQLMTYVSIIH